MVGSTSAVGPPLLSVAGGLYTNVQGTAGKVNVYSNAGVVTIENKQGNTINFRVFSIRLRNSG